MEKDERIYVAGHRGLVGSALVHALRNRGFNRILARTHSELDLTDQDAVRQFFDREKPEAVFLAAAKVGGILANATHPADFIYDNLQIQNNVIGAAWRAGVRRLLFLGSSCIYPRDCPQPIREEYLLTGPLEPTNRPYAIAKIAGIEMCWSFNRQYGTRYLAVMPTNLFGPEDNYDLEKSHVIPALIRKIHLGKLATEKDWRAIARDEEHYGRIPDDIRRALGIPPHSSNESPCVPLWGTGGARREFLYSEDFADAAVHLMSLDEPAFSDLLQTANGQRPWEGNPPLVNIGVGKDITIRELAELVAEELGYAGRLSWDRNKPDGTPQKLLDLTRLDATGWRAPTALREGIRLAYQSYLAPMASVAEEA
jgi:GDP-L-fucose synthase